MMQPTMQVRGEGLRRAPMQAMTNNVKKRRRVALGDLTNTNAKVDASRAPATKRAAKKTKRSPTVGSSLKRLPNGWVTDVSRTSGETYYRNTVTDEAQWEVPVEPAIVENPAIQHVHQTLQHLGAEGLRVIECALSQVHSHQPAHRTVTSTR